MKSVLGLVMAAGCLLAADERVKVDNDVVRILKVVDSPGKKGLMHEHHVNRVMIYLDEGAMKLEFEDGRVDNQRWKPGQVAWSAKGGKHTSQNVGARPVRIAEIELKKPGPATAAVRNREMDPVVTDSEHNVLLFENDQVRVFRSWREAGGRETMHEHLGAGRVVVLLTDIEASVTSADGKTGSLKGTRGEVFWSAGAVKHAGRNDGAKRFEMVMVEVK